MIEDNSNRRLGYKIEMKDKKDMSERLKYLEAERQKQNKRKSLYVKQLEEIKSLLEAKKGEQQKAVHPF